MNEILQRVLKYIYIELDTSCVHGMEYARVLLLVEFLVGFFACVNCMQNHREAVHHRGLLSVSDVKSNNSLHHASRQHHRSITPGKVLDNGAVPSTTSGDTLNKYHAALEKHGEKVMIQEISMLNFSVSCGRKNCDMNMSEVGQHLLDSVGGIVTKSTSIHKEQFIYNPHSVSFFDMLDIAFIFDSSYSNFEQMLHVFNLWKEEVEGQHIVVLLQDVKQLDFFKVPPWFTDYEVFTVESAIRAMDGIKMPKYNLNKDDTIFVSRHSTDQFTQGLGLRNLANWVCDREYIYIIDSFSGIPQNAGVVKQHMINLKTPSLLDYFNSASNPFKPGNDFTRGFPFHLRDGTPTVLSHGLYVGTADYDPLTKLMKGKEPLELSDNSVVTIPRKQLFTLSPVNMAFNRMEIGPALMYHTPILDSKDTQRVGFSKYADVFAGWVLKLCMDECVLGGKHGLPFVLKLPETENADASPSDLVNDPMMNTTTARRVFDAFNGFYMNETTAWKNPECKGRIGCRIECIYSELAKFIRVRLATDFPYFDDFTHSMMIWMNIWSNRHGVLGNIVPKALISSMGPTRPSDIAAAAELTKKGIPVSGRCAAITITHNEKVLLPVWINYYMRHFRRDDIYVLDHMTTDGRYVVCSIVEPVRSTTVEKRSCILVYFIVLQHGAFSYVYFVFIYCLFEVPVGCTFSNSYYLISHIILLICCSTDPSLIPQGINLRIMEGNNFNMPIAFRSKVIQLYQDRLLRAGYKCVVFSDTDEIIVPRPTIFPQGLKEWISKFLEKDLQYLRVRAKELGHISYGNGTEASQEPPIDWNRPILQQRKYYVLDPKYNKPLVSKVRLAYRPGFHKLYDFAMDRFCYTDEDLVMFHIRSVDHKFCMDKERDKLEMSRRMEPQELMKGFADHWYRRKDAEQCRYAIGCFQGPLNNVTARFDNPGTIMMSRLDDYWEQADF
jgi:reversibly glycosylated polypeptide/UDP-arabinopyranose mutase